METGLVSGSDKRCEELPKNFEIISLGKRGVISNEAVVSSDILSQGEAPNVKLSGELV